MAGKSQSGELKGLRTRESTIKAEMDELSARRRELDKQAKSLGGRLRKVQSRIKQLQNKGPVVTEHAILRFLQRGIGIDTRQIRDEILTEDVQIMLKQELSGQVPISKGCRAVIKRGVVVSVVGGEAEYEEFTH